MIRAPPPVSRDQFLPERIHLSQPREQGVRLASPKGYHHVRGSKLRSIKRALARPGRVGKPG